MTPKHLLAHFANVVEAPNAIPRLRGFILDLAVHGKLVDQDPRDEPASILLSRCAKEFQSRSRSTRTGPTRSVDIPTSSLPFSPPPSWSWARLVEMAEVSYGFAFESLRFNANKVGMPLVRIRDISRSETEVYYDGHFDPEYIIHKGDYLVGMDGDFNVRKWQGADALLNQRVMRIRKWCAQLVGDFFAIPLQIILDHLHESTSQTTVKHLSAKQVNGIFLPLPPVAEQRRIVARVDELMRLCDGLEQAQVKRDRWGEQLKSASLQRLSLPTESDGIADGRGYARFHLEHLPRFTAKADQIGALRELILSLAVRGKLVPQDPNEEHAMELLKRIREEQSQSLKGAKIRKGGPPLPLREAETPYEVPQGWAWSEAQELARPGHAITYGILKPVWVESGVPTVRVTEMKSGTIDVRSLPNCDRKRASKFSKTLLREGDLLISKDGTIGKTAFVPPDLAGGNITQHVLRFAISEQVDRRFVRTVIDAPFCQAWMAGETKGVALQGVNVGDFRRMPVPLPPLNEQQRIVAKVEELLALCYQLEAQLAMAQTGRSRLLEAVLREALGPTSQESTFPDGAQSER